MTRVLVDLNLVLDVLLDREPHAESAAALWAAIENKEAEGFLTAHCITTLHYLATRADRRAGDRCVRAVMSVFRVAPVDQDVLEQALNLGWPDFEDAVCAAAAVAAKCQIIATRDAEGFRRAPLPSLDARSTLAVIRAPKRTS